MLEKESLTATLIQGDTTTCCNTLMPEANVCETNSSCRHTPYSNSAPTDLSPLMSLYVFFILLWWVIFKMNEEFKALKFGSQFSMGKVLKPYMSSIAKGPQERTPRAAAVSGPTAAILFIM